jgi:hypothetical protein
MTTYQHVGTIPIEWESSADTLGVDVPEMWGELYICHTCGAAIIEMEHDIMFEGDEIDANDIDVLNYARDKHSLWHE